MRVSQSASNSSRAALLAYVNRGSSTPSSNMLWARHTKGALNMASASVSNPVSMRYLRGRQQGEVQCLVAVCMTGSCRQGMRVSCSACGTSNCVNVTHSLYCFL